jgi:hypothetical protein
MGKTENRLGKWASTSQDLFDPNSNKRAFTINVIP